MRVYVSVLRTRKKEVEAGCRVYHRHDGAATANLTVHTRIYTHRESVCVCESAFVCLEMMIYLFLKL